MHQNYSETQKNNNYFKIISAFIFISFLGGCMALVDGRPKNAPELKTVASVDVTKYVGTWHEIARYPSSFEKDCPKATAQYSLTSATWVNVINTCYYNDGRIKSFKAKASVIKGSNNTKLAVNFAPIPLPKGQGNYWIIYLDPNYQNAIVASPNGNFMWFLSRNEEISKAQLNEMLLAAKSQLFDTDKLEIIGKISESN